jgi:hypothetical protein
MVMLKSRLPVKTSLTRLAVPSNGTRSTRDGQRLPTDREIGGDREETTAIRHGKQGGADWPPAITTPRACTWLRLRSDTIAAPSGRHRTRK